MSHTPGPWHIGEEGWIESATGVIARIAGWTTSDDETRPNALLIAAAPELVDALGALIAACVEYIGGERRTIEKLMAATDAAQAVLSKIAGDQ